MEEVVRIKNSKGLCLAGVLHSPNTSGKCPAVVLLHGFTGYKEEQNIVSLAKDLANSGFVALRFDASGYGESEGTLADDYRISQYLQDVVSIHEYLVQVSEVDPTRVGLWGHSMGALVGIVYASEHPEIKAVCAVSPPVLMGTTDLLWNMMGEWQKSGWFTKVSSRNNNEIRIPYAFIKDAEKYNTLDFVVQLQKPLLVILGIEDCQVNPKDTRLIYETAHEPKQLVEIEGIGHEYKKHPEQIAKVNKYVLSFFDKELGRTYNINT